MIAVILFNRTYAAYKSKEKLGYINGYWVLGGVVVRGGVIYQSWQKAEEGLRVAYNGVKKTIDTPFVKGMIDSLTGQVSHEAKWISIPLCIYSK